MTRRALALTAALVLLSGACGDDDSGEDADPTTTTTAAPADAPSDDEPADDEPAGGDAVTIAGFAFDPSTVEVTAGATVTWTNEDGVAHTVTAGEPSTPEDTFGESVDPGSRADITFEEAGTFPYFCTIHPSMTGEVVVS
jgi:plastocyanin